MNPNDRYRPARPIADRQTSLWRRQYRNARRRSSHAAAFVVPVDRVIRAERDVFAFVARILIGFLVVARHDRDQARSQLIGLHLLFDLFQNLRGPIRPRHQLTARIRTARHVDLGWLGATRQARENIPRVVE